jgi:hypothetical protein
MTILGQTPFRTPTENVEEPGISDNKKLNQISVGLIKDKIEKTGMVCGTSS